MNYVTVLNLNGDSRRRDSVLIRDAEGHRWSDGREFSTWSALLRHRARVETCLALGYRPELSRKWVPLPAMPGTRAARREALIQEFDCYGISP